MSKIIQFCIIFLILNICGCDTEDNQQAKSNTVEIKNTPTKPEDMQLSIKSSAVLNKQIHEAGINRIPSSIRTSAKCIIVFPSVVKAGLIVSAKTGKGLAACKHDTTGTWGAPIYVILSATNVALQAGAQNGSIIFVLLDQGSVEKLIHTDTKIGTYFDIIAGPIGNTVEQNFTASVLSYVRTKGFFAGLDMDKPKVSLHTWQNNVIYGKEASTKYILLENNEIPLRFSQFLSTLEEFTNTEN